MNPYFEWTREELARLVPGARCIVPSQGMMMPATVESVHGAYVFRCGDGSIVRMLGSGPPAMVDPRSLRPPAPSTRDVLTALRELEDRWRADEHADPLAELMALRLRYEDML